MDGLSVIYPARVVRRRSFLSLAEGLGTGAALHVAVRRRSFLSLAEGLGTGAALHVGNNTAVAGLPAGSLDALTGTECPCPSSGLNPRRFFAGIRTFLEAAPIQT